MAGCTKRPPNAVTGDTAGKSPGKGLCKRIVQYEIEPACRKRRQRPLASALYLPVSCPGDGDEVSTSALLLLTFVPRLIVMYLCCEAYTACVHVPVQSAGRIGGARGSSSLTMAARWS